MAVHRSSLRTALPPRMHAWRAARLGTTRVISWDRVNFRRQRRLGPFSRLAFGLDEVTARHSASLLSDPGQPERANVLQSLEVLRPTRDYVPDAYLPRLRGKRRDRHLPGRRGHDLLGRQHALADQPMN